MDSILGKMLGEGFLKTPGGAWRAFDNVERAILIFGSLICGLICIWIGSLVGIPREPHFNGSLLAGGAALSGMIVALVSIVVCMVIGFAFSTVLGLEAGLFCCCMGWAALGVRCGPIRPVLQYAQGNGILVTLAIETAVLGAMLIGVWFGLVHIARRIKPALELNTVAPKEISDATLQQKLMTLGVQIVAMGLCEQIFNQIDSQAQVMAGTLLAAFLGSWVAYMFTPLPNAIWFWTGPTILGVIGFVLASFTSTGIAIGDLHGWAGPLARATPLIYVSMGTAGALLGYWCMRRWTNDEADNEPATNSAST